ncbi:hypothetical protein EJ066_26250 [Mesorhizobium sp. M9A.F.Ca.ET.002.03.1.2]|uniref:hypothetical protein n=1 Tax=Mesorhizobium sp. M9A.F.Ca.ET.002.03.1.2 TaxID=2493668 RepID=UPI000F74DAD5|nr:hypothetical protein [Mesorhizobium sp. M9A.F.Ca.ET.002.03.1.2]AZO00345.1 hypothetical protein EJ066_26250 [Mesorhizobium sp. M9A.F.Ca.ET.002.03.1.2]
MAELAQVGDIVHVSAAAGPWCKWVVAGFVVSPQGRNAKLLRKTSFGTYSSSQKRVEGLALIERPVFKSGDKVVVDGNRGEFMCFEKGGDVVRIMLAPRRRHFTGVGFIDIAPAVVRTNYWMLVIENSKRLMEK